MPAHGPPSSRCAQQRAAGATRCRGGLYCDVRQGVALRFPQIDCWCVTGGQFTRVRAFGHARTPAEGRVLVLGPKNRIEQRPAAALCGFEPPASLPHHTAPLPGHPTSVKACSAFPRAGLLPPWGGRLWVAACAPTRLPAPVWLRFSKTGRLAALSLQPLLRRSLGNRFVISAERTMVGYGRLFCTRIACTAMHGLPQTGCVSE